MGVTLLAVVALALAAWFGRGLIKDVPEVLKGRIRMIAGSIGLGVGVSLIASGRIAPGIVLCLAGAWGLGWFDGFSKADADRGGAGWRENADAHADPRQGRAARPGAMTEKEAYEILGLDAGAGEEAIRAAHRALIKKIHPDAGGSAALAARVNEAKDILVKGHR